MTLPAGLVQSPKVYRAMRRDPADGLPVVGSTSSSELGVRPGSDVAVDSAGEVVLDGSGMSVAPGWRDLNESRIPKRLRSIWPGADGPNNTACFTFGAGPFSRGIVADGLELVPDSDIDPIKHGVIAPLEVVSVVQYQTDLGNTRADWLIDET